MELIESKEQVKKIRKGDYILLVGSGEGNFNIKWLAYVEKRRGFRIKTTFYLLHKARYKNWEAKLGEISGGSFILPVKDSWKEYILNKKEVEEYKLKLTELRI